MKNIYSQKNTDENRESFIRTYLHYFYNSSWCAKNVEAEDAQDNAERIYQACLNLDDEELLTTFHAKNCADWDSVEREEEAEAAEAREQG